MKKSLTAAARYSSARGPAAASATHAARSKCRYSSTDVKGSANSRGACCAYSAAAAVTSALLARRARFFAQAPPQLREDELAEGLLRAVAVLADLAVLLEVAEVRDADRERDGLRVAVS